MSGVSDLVRTVLAAVATIGLAAGAASGVAWWLFRTFAKGWLQAQFDRHLETFRAANLRELERLRADISRLMDRATKFHEREYEVLPAAWGI